MTLSHWLWGELLNGLVSAKEQQYQTDKRLKLTFCLFLIQNPPAAELKPLLISEINLNVVDKLDDLFHISLQPHYTRLHEATNFLRPTASSWSSSPCETAFLLLIFCVCPRTKSIDNREWSRPRLSRVHWPGRAYFGYNIYYAPSLQRDQTTTTTTG